MVALFVRLLAAPQEIRQRHSIECTGNEVRPLWVQAVRIGLLPPAGRRDVQALPRITEDGSSEAAVSAKALALAEHMVDHRRFYRALYTSACGFALSKALNSLFLPVNRQVVCDAYGRQIDERTTEDIAAFLTGGWGDFVRAWVVEDPDPLDPHEFTSRLVHIASMVLPQGRPTSATFKGAEDGN